MKKNIAWYDHSSSSHVHWKFKLLRSKFGWEGEGRFWALNNIIAQSDDCLLDLNRKNLFVSVSSDLGLTADEFKEYLDFLINECELLIDLDGKVTNDTLRDVFVKVMKERERCRQKKQGSIHNKKHLGPLNVFGISTKKR